MKEKFKQLKSFNYRLFASLFKSLQSWCYNSQTLNIIFKKMATSESVSGVAAFLFYANLISDLFSTVISLFYDIPITAHRTVKILLTFC